MSIPAPKQQQQEQQQQLKNEKQKNKMKGRKPSILVLCDHKTSKPSNSLLPLVKTLSSNPKCKRVCLASRGNPENSRFFRYYESSELAVQNIKDTFDYEKFSSQSNVESAQVMDFDFIINRLSRPVADQFYDFLNRFVPSSRVINNPAGTKACGSKAFLLNFPSLCPPMKLCKTTNDIISFKDDFPIVLKPLEEGGGMGLIKIDGDKLWDGKNDPVAFNDFLPELGSRLTKTHYLGMKFLKNVSQGDKRVLVVDGKIVGWYVRKPPSDSWLCNIRQGGTGEASELEESEKKIAETLDPVMKSYGIAYYGFDTLVDDDGVRILSEINPGNVGGFVNAEKYMEKEVLNPAADLLMDYMLSAYGKQDISPNSANILKISAFHGPNRWSTTCRLISMYIDVADLDVLLTENDELRETVKTRLAREHPSNEKEYLENKGSAAHLIAALARDTQEGWNKEPYGRVRHLKEKKGRTDKPSIYHILYQYQDDTELGRGYGTQAVELLNTLILNPATDLAGIKTKYHLNDYVLGPTVRAIAVEAERVGIPYQRLSKDSQLIQLGWGINTKWFRTLGSFNNNMSNEISDDKETTKKVLDSVGIPIPRGSLASSLQEAISIASDLGWPLVTKPRDSKGGQGVTVNVRTMDDLKKGYKFARNYSRWVMIERFVNGKDYRILVVYDQVVAVTERVPAFVTGDGESNIQNLIHIANSDPRRGISHENVMTKIKIDENTITVLEKAGYTLESIPPKEERVYVKGTANLSTGGVGIDMTDVIHYHNSILCIRAAKAVGLDVAGIDIITEDISSPISETGGVVIEVNSRPGTRMHISPYEGTPRDPTPLVIEAMFPTKKAKIPIIAVGGSNGKTTVSKMIAHILQNTAYQVGMAVSDGVYIQGIRFHPRVADRAWGTKTVLSDPTVTVAVLETNSKSLMEAGLAFDSCNVAAILNIKEEVDDSEDEDDLGEGELPEPIEGLLYDVCGAGTKSKMVVNADDKSVVELAKKRGKKNIIYVSVDPNNPILQSSEFKNSSSVAIIVKDEAMCLYTGKTCTKIIDINLIPATFHGLMEVNVINSLFAFACCYALGVRTEKIKYALMSLRIQSIPGRMNLFSYVNGSHILVDSPYNLAAIKALGKFVKKMREARHGVTHATILTVLAEKLTSAFLTKCDREISQYFDNSIVVERGGRTTSDVLEIVKKNKKTRMTILKSSLDDAVSYALDMLRGNQELLVIVSDRPVEVLEQLRSVCVELN